MKALVRDRKRRLPFNIRPHTANSRVLHRGPGPCVRHRHGKSRTFLHGQDRWREFQKDDVLLRGGDGVVGDECPQHVVAGLVALRLASLGGVTGRVGGDHVVD